MVAPRELSVFVDESGDVGSLQAHSPFYILGLVFHDQSYSISSNVQIIRTKLVQRGFSQNHAIHTAPLIRGEYEYEWLKLDKRRALFRDLFHFFRSCKVRQRTLLLNKQTVGHGADLLAALATELSNVISNNRVCCRSW